MITLTPAEEVLRQYIIGLASHRMEPQSYGEIADAIDKPTVGIEELAREMFPEAYEAITDNKPMPAELIEAVKREQARRGSALGFSSGRPRFTRLIHALYHVNVFENEHGRPMVGALAVSKSTGCSGAGFADVGRGRGLHIARTAEDEFAFWQEQVEKSYTYWSDHDNDSETLLSDSQFSAIMTELSALKKLVRQALHS